MQSLLCYPTGQTTKKMLLTKTMFPWVSWFLLTCLTVSAIQVREPENETERTVPTSSSAALSATEPTDNGMAVGEAPEIESAASSAAPALQLDVQTENYVPSASASPTVDAIFPENHRNTSNPSLATIESPPFLQAYNKYQQQYRDYYNQKSQFVATAKPFKFEETTSGFVPSLPHSGFSNFGDESEIENNIKLRNKPFPYFFEGASLPEPTQQVAYPIPDHNDLETSFGDEEDENKDPLPSTAPFKPSIPFGFPFSNLFGGNKQPSNHLAHSEGHRSEVTKHKGNNGSWKKIIKVLTTVVPFGLFLATLTPNLLYINTTEENKPSRLRSLDDGPVTLEDPLVDIVQRLGGLEAMKDPLCEDRFFCEMSVLGKGSQSNFVEKGFWYLAHETPDNVAQDLGMKELFDAIKTNTCEKFICEKKAEKADESLDHPSITKKDLKPRKTPKKYKGS